jgi:hypothetical protein
MADRRQLTIEEARKELVGATVTDVAYEAASDGYIILRLGELTLYASAPTVYGPAA